MRTITVAAIFAALVSTGVEGQEDVTDEGAPVAEQSGEPTGDAAAEPTEEETLGLSMGEEQTSQIGQTYTLEEHADWDVRCVRTESGNDPCQLYQLLEDEDGNSVAEISIFPLPTSDGPAVAGATIITPLETLLTAQIALRVDSGAPKRYPFSWCSSVGCFSRIGFTAEEVVSFRRGATATISIRPVAAPDQTVDLQISLAGFTDGYEAVAEANAE